MKKTVIFIVFIVAVAGVIGVSAFTKDMGETVGYLDGQAVTVADLQNYVTNLLGKKYEKMMDTKEGRKELFGHYVDRKLLLEYAKKHINKDDSFVVSHTMGNVSNDSALLSAVIKEDINDKVRYTRQDVLNLLHSDKKYKTKEQAERDIVSQQRIALFHKLMNKIKANHKISLES